MPASQHNPQIQYSKKHGPVFAGLLDILKKANHLLVHPFHHHFKKHYLDKYKHPHHLFIFDLILIGIIVTLLAITIWFIFLQPTLVNQIELKTETSPQEIVSGERLTYTIYYENKSKETLENAKLTVRLPAHFNLLQTYPKDYNERTGAFYLDTLPPGASGQAKINGIFWGEVGKSTVLYSALDFKSQKTGRRDMKFVRSDFLVKNSVLEVSFNLPEYLIADQFIHFNLTYKNNSSETLRRVTFSPVWPTGSEVSPFVEESYGQNRWIIDEFAPGNHGLKNFLIHLPNQGNQVNFVFNYSIEVDGIELKQGDLQFQKNLIPQPLKINLALEGVADSYVKPGTNLKALIAYENTGPFALQNVDIGLLINSLFSSENKIENNASTNPELASLAAGGRGLIPIEFRLLDHPNRNTNENKNFILKLQPIGQADAVNTVIEARGEDSSWRIETPFETTTTARYWTEEGDQIGRGALPPRVDDITKYWIFWHLLPTTNDIEHLEFYAELPVNVEWTGRSNVTVGSPLVWHPEKRAITWDIDQLPATYGSSGGITARFEVALTPDESQVGMPTELLKQTQISAQDLFTNSRLETNAPTITTNLTSDIRARGKGNVAR